ncbi:MAG TPA: DUF951 domain-containing protein [Christensenellaceae bacterium]|jgi:hypothetical protein|nr:DUF951 domain-containing protein [Christensenellaceae bacterium]
MTDEIRLDDVVQMKKKHPCGSYEWTVTRIGADIKMRCNTCGRVVMLDRMVFLRRRKKLLKQGPVPADVTLGFAEQEIEGDTTDD